MTKKWTKNQIIRDVYQLVKEQFCLTLDFDDVDDDFLSGCDIAKREMKKLIKNTEEKFDIQITKQEIQQLSNVADVMVITIEKISERGDLIGAGLRPQPWREVQWRPNIQFRPNRITASDIAAADHLHAVPRQLMYYRGEDDYDEINVKKLNIYNKAYSHVK